MGIKTNACAVTVWLPLFYSIILFGNGCSLTTTNPTSGFEVPSKREWRLIGPGISGCMAEIAFHPTDPKTIYSGTDMGAAFKTTDGGLTWKMLGGASLTNRNPSDLAHRFRSIAVAPDNPDVVWFSCGNTYKSEDAGKTIKQVDVSTLFPVYMGVPNNVYIDPTDGNIVYLLKCDADLKRPRQFDGQLARTLDGGKTWKTVVKWPTNAPHYWSTLVIDRYSPFVKGQGHQRLYLCGRDCLLQSDDGGATWNEIFGDLPKGIVSDLVVIPQTGGQTILFALCLAGDAKEKLSGYLYRSEDNGKSWKQKMNRIEIYYSSYRPHFSLASTPADPKTLYYAAGNCRVYRSRNLGDTWEIICQVNDAAIREKIKGTAFGGKEVDFFFLKKDGDTYVDCSAYALPTKGDTCRHNQYSWSMGVHPSLAVSPSDSNVIAFIQGTVIATTNAGQTWDDICSDLGAPFAKSRWPDEKYAPSDHTHLMKSRGAQVIVPRQAAFDPFDPCHTIAIAYMDIGLRISRDGGQWWEWAYDKACMTKENTTSAHVVTYDPTVKGRIYMGSGYHTLGDVFRSDDAGRTFTRLHIAPLWAKVKKIKEETGVLHKPDVYRIVVDPSSPADKRTLYVGVNLWKRAEVPLAGIYKSEDGGITWREASDGMGLTANIHELIIDPRNPKILYAGVYEYNSKGVNGLFKTTDGGKLWTKIAPDLFGGITVYGISQCQTRPDTLYVVAFPPGKEGWRGQKSLFRSDDGGGTWREIRKASATSSANYVASVAVNPFDPDWIYITQSHHHNDSAGVGAVFRSKDGGRTWEAIDDDKIPESAEHTFIQIDPCDARRLIHYSPYGLWIGFDPEAPHAGEKQ